MTAEVLMNWDLVIDELIQGNSGELDCFSTATFGINRSRSPGELIDLSMITFCETLAYCGPSATTSFESQGLLVNIPAVDTVRELTCRRWINRPGEKRRSSADFCFVTIEN